MLDINFEVILCIKSEVKYFRYLKVRIFCALTATEEIIFVIEAITLHYEMFKYNLVANSRSYPWLILIFIIGICKIRVYS